MPIHYYILGRILNSPTTLVLSFLGFLLAVSGDVFFQLSPEHLKLPPVASCQKSPSKMEVSQWEHNLCMGDCPLCDYQRVS